jgi:hypothetical protein
MSVEIISPKLKKKSEDADYAARKFGSVNQGSLIDFCQLVKKPRRLA